jgi:hypothetical protein
MMMKMTVVSVLAVLVVLTIGSPQPGFPQGGNDIKAPDERGRSAQGRADCDPTRTPGTEDPPAGSEAARCVANRAPERREPRRSKPLSCPFPDPAVSPAGAFLGWPDSLRPIGPAHASPRPHRATPKSWTRRIPPGAVLDTHRAGGAALGSRVGVNPPWGHNREAAFMSSTTLSADPDVTQPWALRGGLQCKRRARCLTVSAARTPRHACCLGATRSSVSYGTSAVSAA